MKANSLLINEPPLQVLPSLASRIGLNEAIAVQQLHSLLENPMTSIERDGFIWVFRTYEEWHAKFPFWSERTIQRIFTNLEKIGLVVSAQLDKSFLERCKYYRIDYNVLCTINS